MIIIGINNFELDLFIVTTITSCDQYGVHIDERVVTGHIQNHSVMCETFEIQ